MNLKPLLAKGEKLNWRTPKRLFQKLNEEFNFMLDAATSDDNPLNTPYFCTEKDDALTKEWINPTYVNPPYSHNSGPAMKIIPISLSTFGNIL